MTSLTGPLDISLFVLSFWGITGTLGFFLLRRSRAFLGPLLFLLASGAAVLSCSGIWGLADSTDLHRILPGGLPGLPFHFRQDPLSSFFLLLLGGAGTGILIFAAGYLRSLPSPRLPSFFFRTALFMASMEGVLLADDAYVFMVFWETMALVSYALVVTENDREEVRNAGFLYLLMAHLGSLLILVAFFFLASREPSGFAGGLQSFTFESMGKSLPSPGVALLVFVCALLGFGAKAGLIPLHVWLPEAHPVAPSPASALLSGVMLKTAIYGLLRVFFGLLGPDHLNYSFGIPVLLAGGFMALFGILHALLQSDPKKLLAYSSIENIGIIFLGIGLSILYLRSGHPIAGDIALGASLYHAINHAFFKSLLFLGAGTMAHASGTNDLNTMGGLLRRMPYSGVFVLFGVLCISGLPPGNGFVSEWLLLQASLQAGTLSGTLFRSAVLLGAALLVLASALAAMGFVKFYGIGYLGIPRSEGAQKAHEVSLPERLGMAWLVAGCLLLALLPVLMLAWIGRVLRPLTGSSFSEATLSSGWMQLLPLSPQGASYTPALLLGLLCLLIPLAWLIPRFFGRGSSRRAPVWGCGYEIRTPRMQDSAGSFGQPIRHFFADFFLMKRHLPEPTEKDPVFELTVEDPHWAFLYRPVFRLFQALASLAERVRTGRISVYLVYSFGTLILLLSVFRWMV
ncbi:MAG: hydrogenase 4 subunit B [Nitrospirae bacterium]|nr:hydrogenase 4 subunit B [Nitrospirota bacterium]MCL5285292.1 hydrogenase 4 subunit B [Nitrospirota bacterium]